MRFLTGLFLLTQVFCVQSESQFEFVEFDLPKYVPKIVVVDSPIPQREFKVVLNMRVDSQSRYFVEPESFSELITQVREMLPSSLFEQLMARYTVTDKVDFEYSEREFSLFFRDFSQFLTVEWFLLDTEFGRFSSNLVSEYDISLILVVLAEHWSKTAGTNLKPKYEDLLKLALSVEDENGKKVADFWISKLNGQGQGD